ncbi:MULTISPECIES: hypothetical protein [Alphaproteobacteria]|uniref:Uncharacterized protein n=2 Tax=Alphaproteobacteria TaxID=28211 RepID=A0A512HGJ9_9HYPH|nr:MULTISPECIES: hypothetical protein [Alphaproteobacteria]GEO84572.1 hypothetical protein RNA01_15040 [Ciceribacter naphthalenivorans]GLR22535.1 hypothetical protein GCM10007920_23220 [Ciceribacter naphthalenivorans]GLT05391.1 hypothetical protein GCM10007926_23220 [Sphingomonas psychrolutea]
MATRLLIRTTLSLAAFLFLAIESQALAGTPSCEQVTGTVSGRFAANMRGFLGLDLSIAEYGMISENRLETRDGTHRVERRYCHAKITTTDGARRQVWYLIENNWGFAGLGSSVEFCVSGLDPWHVYGARCKSLR